MTKHVHELNTGDDLGNCVIIGKPVHYGDYCGHKDRMSVRVRYSNGKESVRLWGRTTTVTVK